jgi:hypothetical protein
MQTSKSSHNLHPSKKFQHNSKKQSKSMVISGEWYSDPRVPNRTACIGAEMSPEEQVELLQFLDKNSDVFAWSTSDLVGVSREVIEHKL